jgi:hypothetical protein
MEPDGTWNLGDFGHGSETKLRIPMVHHFPYENAISQGLPSAGGLHWMLQTRPTFPIVMFSPCFLMFFCW